MKLKSHGSAMFCATGFEARDLVIRMTNRPSFAGDFLCQRREERRRRCE